MIEEQSKALSIFQPKPDPGSTAYMQPFPPFPDSEASEPDEYVEFHFEDVSFDFPEPDTVGPWLLNVAEAEGKAVHEITYIFCSDEYLRQINVEYLDHDYFTDIITFDYSEGETISGDLFISVDQWRRPVNKNLIARLLGHSEY